MASNRRPYWRALGTPTSIVVCRTPDGWRYAVHFTGPAGIVDGTLAGTPPSSEPDVEQAALVQKAEELTHRRLDVPWHAPDQPEGWIGTVSVAHFHLPEADASVRSGRQTPTASAIAPQQQPPRQCCCRNPYGVHPLTVLGLWLIFCGAVALRAVETLLTRPGSQVASRPSRGRCRRIPSARPQLRARRERMGW